MGIPFDKITHAHHAGTTSANTDTAAANKEIVLSSFKEAYRNAIGNMVSAGAAVYTETIDPRDGIVFPTAVVEADSSNPAQVNICRLTDTLYVVMFLVADTSLEVAAVSIDGTTPTVGTAVHVNTDAAADTDSANICAIGTAGTHFCCVYRDEEGDDYLCARIGSVSGTTITMGTEKELTAAATTENAATPYGICEPRAGVLGFAYADGDDDLATIAATYSGTTIATPGSVVEFDAAAPDQISCCKMEEGYMFVAYADGGDSNKFHARVASVSAAAAIGTPGTEKTVVDLAATYINAKNVEQNKVIVAYEDNANDPEAVVCTTAAGGTTITAGTAKNFLAGTVTDVGVDMIDNTQGIIKWDNGTNGDCVRFSISGTTITADAKLDTFVETSSTGGGAGGISCSTTGKCVIAYEDADNDTGVLVGQYYENRVVDIRSATASINYEFDVIPVFEYEASN